MTPRPTYRSSPRRFARSLAATLSFAALLSPVLAHAQEAPSAPVPVVETAPATKAADPFAFGDFTWLNGSNRQHKALLDTPYFTGSFLLDVNYTASENNPIDHTVVGSTALSRNNEFTLAFIGFGGDFHYEHARGRLMTQFGLRSTLVPRNDASTNRGQFDMQTALRYLSEAYGGYHWDVLNGVNLDVGIFMSYVGLFSYDNFENWMYLPSFTSDNTPWFFNGIRLQVFTSDKLKIEPWIINGWQSYGKFNEMPGFGAQVLWRPLEWVSALSNSYVGWDTQDNPGRVRFHSDNSLQIRYYNDPDNHTFTRAAFSLTGDIGGEHGDGVTPFGGKGTEGHCTTATPCTQQFLSAMLYNRLWFFDGHLGFTVGGGVMHNPGRYLVLAPTGNASPFPQPLNVPGATQPYDLNPGSKFDAFDYEAGIQYMPDEQQTWNLEFNHRQTNVPYFAGHGGVTSPDGYVTTPVPAGWRPDLVKNDTRVILAFLLRFLELGAAHEPRIDDTFADVSQSHALLRDHHARLHPRMDVLVRRNWVQRGARRRSLQPELEPRRMQLGAHLPTTIHLCRELLLPGGSFQEHRSLLQRLGMPARGRRNRCCGGWV